MEISVLAIDLAKTVFQLHGNDARGKGVLKKKLKRDELMNYVAQIPACIVAMEACGGSHHWAREFRKLGHEVRLISPQFVKPFVKSNKNDALDAEAIAEAAVRPNMRFVAIKELWQQEILSLHRTRSLFLANRVAISNSIRGLLEEFGLILPTGVGAFKKGIVAILESSRLSPTLQELIHGSWKQFEALEKEIKRIERKIEEFAEEYEDCRRLRKIEGVGPLTASAAVAVIGDPKTFKNGRQFAAYVGLVPRQHSSGGKEVLLGISKRGDRYLRSLMIHGARAALMMAHRRDTRRGHWAVEKLRTKGVNKATVALANHNARVMWALMAKKEKYNAA